MDSVHGAIMDATAFKKLLGEVTELKKMVLFLQDENAKLKQEQEQKSTDVQEQLSAAKDEIKRVNALNITLREYINSIDNMEGAIPSTEECPRKIAKKCTPTVQMMDTTPQVDSAYNTINTTNTDSFTTVTSKKSKKKIIQTINSNLKTIKNKIKAANCNNFSLKQSGQNAPIKIELNSPSDISNVREALKEAKISFHEYKWNEEKAKCFMIKGLVGTSDEDLPHIKNTLINDGLPSDIKVSLFITGFMRANPNQNHNSIIKLVLPPNSDEKILKNMKFIDHVSVKVEKMKTKNIIQCKNCQRFGHSAGGCMHPHRCVKCGLNHYRDNCGRTHDKSVKLKCCNCGGEHTANNLAACQFFQQKYVKSNEKTKPANMNAGTSKQVVPGVSFAQVTGGHLRSNVRSKSSGSQNTSSTTKNVSNSSSLESKVDMLIQLVSRHDVLLMNLVKNG